VAGFRRVAVAAAALMLTAAIAEAWTRYPQPFRNPAPYVARLWGPTGVPTAAVAQFVNARDGWLVAAEGAVSGDVVGEFLVDRVQPGPQVLLRTTDGGGRWRQVARIGAPVAALDFISPEEGYLLLKSGGTGGARGTMTLLEASDGGRALRIAARLPLGSGSCAMDWPTLQEGFVVCGGRMDVTSDGGRTWRAAALDLPAGASGEPYAPYFLNADTGFATARGSIYRTADGGGHWQRVYRLPPKVAGDFALGPVAFATPERGYAVLNFSSCWPGGCPDAVLATSDGGRHWQPVAAQLDPSLPLSAPRTGPPGGVDAIIAWGQEDVAVVSMTSVSMSGDGGRRWTILPLAMPTSPVLAHAGREVFAAELGGLVRVEMDGSFRQSWPALAPTSQVDVVDARLAYGLSLQPGLALLRSTDGGRTWHRLRLPRRGVYATISFADRRHGWIDVYPSGEILGTDDGGKVWHAAAAAPATFAELFPGGRGVLLRRTDGAPPRYLELTWDGGRTFERRALPRGMPWNGAIAFASPSSGFAVWSGQMWQTSDAAASWRRLPLPAAFRAAQWIVASADRRGDLWLGAALQPTVSSRVQYAVFERLAGGRWQESRLPALLPLGTGMGLDAVSAGKAWLVTPAGLFETTDGGRTWRNRTGPTAL